MELDFTVNRLILGDNLEILKTLPAETVDQIGRARLPELAEGRDLIIQP